MMKLAVTALSLFLASNPSQANTNQTITVLESPKHSELKIQTPMRNVAVRAIPRTKRLLIANDLTDGEDDPAGPDELDLHGPYNRAALTKGTANQKLSNYVKIRLLLARTKAMKKYQEVWG